MAAVRYLADTSVLLDFIGRRIKSQSDTLEQALRQQQVVGISAAILRETLQGARDASALEALRARLVRLPMFEPSDIYNSRVSAALIYARLRWRGHTVRSSVDCLIALTAIEHDLVLLHDDRDFDAIASIEPRLKLA